MSINKTEQFILFKRLIIIFGSICFLWLIIGFIFLSIQIYQNLKKKTKQKLFRYNRFLQLPLLLLKPIDNTLKDDKISDNEQNDSDNDDQASIFTSISFISERSKNIHEHTHFTISCQQIPEEQFELTFSNIAGISNLAYSQSTLTSSNDIATSLVYYPTCENFTYSQSSFSSLNDNLHSNTGTSSLIIPINSSSSSIHQFYLNHQSSSPSTNTILSQITNATYLSSQSLIKTIQLPTVMITDVDRLQTDIIELENFEPEKDWYNTRSQLRLLLNDRMPP